ncbi:hypothetical protein Fot_38253 [Forsythia ovata]|uniref:Uncharacterized protein n=1 Tax=Forsythia ovata TaxID=205694 RepID=A0ABD1S1A0_9LAMI
MSRKIKGRLRNNYLDAPLQAAADQEHSPPKFVTLQQFMAPQDQMSTILMMLQRVTAPPPLAVETIPVEITPPPEVTSSNHQIVQKIKKAIACRKNKGRSISIKEDLFIEELMNVPLPPKFKEPTDEFDGMTDPIDHMDG